MIGLTIPLIFILAIALALVYALWQKAKRQAFIRETPLLPGLLDSLILPFPELALKDWQLIARGL